MDKKRLAFKASLGCAVGLFATAALADPFTLQGACRLTSMIPGQGQCELDVLITDSPLATADVITQGLLTVDGVPVAVYLNDNANPASVLGSITVAGATVVTCGASHTVRAYMHKSSAPGVEERVGSLPPITCPTAPAAG